MGVYTKLTGCHIVYFKFANNNQLAVDSALSVDNKQSVVYSG